MLSFAKFSSLYGLMTAGLMAQGARPMTLVDVMNVPQISDPQVSSSGREILYVQSEPNWKANRRVGHIWKVNSDGSVAIQMTSGTDGENSPRWSPDGKTIAFIAKRGTEPEAVAQIFLMADAGGEARALTTHATAVSNIAWSPDGAMIYFRAPDPKSDELKAREKVKDDVFMFDEDYQQQHLWNIAVAAKTEHRITKGDFSVLGYNLSNDGKKIVFHRSPTPLIEDQDQSEVWLMDAAGTGLKQITRNNVQESEATLSPYNSQILFLSQADQKFETYYNRKVFVASAAGGDAKVLMPQLPYEVDKASWSKDWKNIFFPGEYGRPHGVVQGRSDES